MANTKQPNKTVSALGDTSIWLNSVESQMGEMQKALSEEAELVPRSKQLVAAT